MVEFYNQFNRLLLCLETPIVPFRALEPGEKVPTYEAIIHTDRVEFLEVKE